MSSGPIQVLVATASPWDVPNFYRTVGPLMADPRYSVKVTRQAELTWVDLTNVDVVCLPRVYRNDELRIAELAHAAGTKVWVDYDDNLLDVPEANPAFVEFMQPSAREGVLTALAAADLVTVSTEALRVALQAARPDDKQPVVVVKNGLNPAWPKRAETHNRSDTFYWRGSSTHVTDVLKYSAAIAQGLPETATMQIMGWFAWPLAAPILERGINLSYTKELPINFFYRELENSGATCCVVPLEDNPFNRCKSNIAQLEAAAVGALAITPDWPEWDLPGTIKYTDEESMKAAVARYMETPYEERRATWIQLRDAAIAQSVAAVEARYNALASLFTKPETPPSPLNAEAVPPVPPPASRLQLVPPTYSADAAAVLH